MLIEFSVGNFTSFNKINKLTMVSTSKRELKTHTVAIEKSKNPKIMLNRLAAFFGANASGKSNFFYALRIMRVIITNSGLSLSQDKVRRKGREMPPFKPFAFTAEGSKRPTTFEIVFSSKDEKIYRYGFSYEEKRFSREWLYVRRDPKQKEAELFTREGTSISGEKESDLEPSRKHITDERLAFTILAELQVEPYVQAMNFFQNIEAVPSSDSPHLEELAELARNVDGRLLSKLLRFADTGLRTISAEELSEEVSEEERQKALQNAPEEVQALIRAIEGLSPGDNKMFKCKFHHEVYDYASDNVRECHLTWKDESRGTLRYISLISYFLDALKNDKLLIVDEMDSSLHPFLVEGLIRLFTEAGSRAQLLFSSHCPFLFDQQKIRRDELWLVNKNGLGESQMASASDFQARGDGNLAKGYLDGKFSGIPYVQYHLLEDCVKAINAYIAGGRKEA